MNEISIDITLEDGVDTPKYGTAYSSGFDLAANLPKAEAIQDYVTKLTNVFGKVLGVDYRLDFTNDIPALKIHAGRSIPIPTGIRIAIPEGYEMQVRPRSGNAIKLGLTVINSPGTVNHMDQDNSLYL